MIRDCNWQPHLCAIWRIMTKLQYQASWIGSNRANRYHKKHLTIIWAIKIQFKHMDTTSVPMPTWSSENLSERDEIEPELSVSPGLFSDDFLRQSQLLRSIYDIISKSSNWYHLPYSLTTVTHLQHHYTTQHKKTQNLIRETRLNGIWQWHQSGSYQNLHSASEIHTIRETKIGEWNQNRVWNRTEGKWLVMSFA